MAEQYKLKPCPLCGGTRIGQWNSNDCGTIMCYRCSITMRKPPVEEEYVLIEGDLYRKKPYRSGLEVAAEAWNKREGWEE